MKADGKIALRMFSSRRLRAAVPCEARAWAVLLLEGSAGRQLFGRRAFRNSSHAHALRAAAMTVSARNHGSPATRGSANIRATCAITIRANTVPTVTRKAFMLSLDRRFHFQIDRVAILRERLLALGFQQ